MLLKGGMAGKSRAREELTGHVTQQAELGSFRANGEEAEVD